MELEEVKVELTAKELDSIAQALGELEVKIKESEKVLAIVNFLRDKYKAAASAKQSAPKVVAEEK